LDTARIEAQRRFAEAIHGKPSGIISRTVRLSWTPDATVPELRENQVEVLAKEFFARALAEMDKEELPPVGWEADALANYRVELADRLALLTRGSPEELEGLLDGAQTSILARSRLRAEPCNPSYDLLKNFVRRALIQLAAIRLARLDGDFSDNIGDRLFRPDLTDNRSAPVRQSSATVREVADRYFDEDLAIRSVTEKTSLKHKALLSEISAFFGEQTLICNVERPDCLRFRDVLAKLPPNFSKSYPRLSVEEIVAKNEGGATLAWETQNNYLTMLVKMLAWAKGERLVSDNVAENIKPRVPSSTGQRKRLPFKTDELSRIFSAPIYTGCKDDEHGHAKPGPHIIRRSRYWLPLIALYSGMRLNEILQLSADHVRVSANGTPFFLLTPDMELKTEAAVREVPVHQRLVDCGFLAWVDMQREAGKPDLFDDVPESKHGYRSDIFSKRYATFLKSISLADDRRSKLCFHSFRHTFKDALNDTDAPEGEMDEICGWARSKKTGRRYGTGFSADRLKPYVDQVAYDVDLSHLVAHACLPLG